MRALNPLLLLSVFALVACDAIPNGSGGGDEDDGLGDDDDGAPAQNPYGEADNCPVFETGTVTIQVGSTPRTLEIELPENPERAPVVFAWHWLGSNATETLDWMGIRALADDGYVIVAPETSGLPVEWDTTDDSDDNVDLQMLDAILPCLWDQFQIDDDRVFATGMSAGGLMTTFLTMYRADLFAATAVFSGGTWATYYSTPVEPIPVMVTWGGPGDSYGGFSFHTSSLAFIELLEDDGHLVVACEHTGGHAPPYETVPMLETFFGDHRRGRDSPWVDGLPSGLPNWCE
jgi:predicted esterase